MKIITKDLFEACYLMTQGMRLEEMSGDERTVLFQFAGDESLGILKHKYDQGRAETNVLKFKKNLAQLKDMMFAKIRNSEQGRKGRYERNSYSKSQVC